MCQGEVCTDADGDGNDDNAADANNDGQCMIGKGSLVDKPNKPKNHSCGHYLHISPYFTAYFNFQNICAHVGGTFPNTHQKSQPLTTLSCKK